MSVNEQPPMHQLKMRRSSRFGDESKTHPPLTKVFGFFSLCSTGKVFPSYLLPTYLPLLPTSPHFALTPSSKLGRAWSKKAKLGASSVGVEVAAKSARAKLATINGRAKVATKSKRVEVVARITCLKRKPKG